MIQANDVERALQELPNLETVPIGPGRHFVQEDNPHAIGGSVSGLVQEDVRA